MHINQCFYDVNLLIEGNFVCVIIKRDPHTEEVLHGQKLPRKKGWFSQILTEGHRFRQFNLVKLMLKAKDNKFAHVLAQNKS